MIIARPLRRLLAFRNGKTLIVGGTPTRPRDEGVKPANIQSQCVVPSLPEPAGMHPPGTCELVKRVNFVPRKGQANLDLRLFH